MRRHTRVFLGIDQVGGHLWALHLALSRLGIDSDVLYFRTTPVDMPATHDCRFRGAPRPLRVTLKTLCAIAAVARHGLMHFNNAWSFLINQTDLAFLHAIKKPTFVTFNGSNVRPARYSLEHFRYSQFGIEGVPIGEVPESDDDVRRRIELWERHASAIFCLNPDLCRYIHDPIFIPYLKDTVLDAPAGRIPRKSPTIRIAHAPTHRGIKGTQRFISAVEKLRSEGADIELVLIERLTREKALELIRTCDVLLDQLLVGWYGGVAVEAMAMGVPVMCYVREEDLGFVPPDMRAAIPILRTSWASVYDDLERVVEDAPALVEHGERSRRYVLEYHDPVKIAERILKEYRKVVSM